LSTKVGGEQRYCVFCKNEAEYLIEDTNTPICPACKIVYQSGQANPDAGFIDIGIIDIEMLQ